MWATASHPVLLHVPSTITPFTLTAYHNRADEHNAPLVKMQASAELNVQLVIPVQFLREEFAAPSLCDSQYFPFHRFPLNGVRLVAEGSAMKRGSRSCENGAPREGNRTRSALWL